MTHPTNRPPAPNRTRPKLLEINLNRLDELEADALALFCWSNVRPLSGAAGYVDWRMCGFLSRALQGGFFQGNVSEVLMIPTGTGRFGGRRVFLFGLGALATWNAERCRNAYRHAIEVLKRAGATKIVLAAPSLPFDKTLESHFVEEARLDPELDCLLIAKEPVRASTSW